MYDEEIFKHYDKLYLIFRIYSKKEQPDPKSRSKHWGWSTSKDVVKALFRQRSKKKYKVISIICEEVTEQFKIMADHNNYFDLEMMVDIVQLKSSKTGETVNMFTTSAELREYEIKIQEKMRELSSISSIKDVKGSGMNILELFVNLQDEYADALYRIGYRPRELDALDGNMFYGSGELDDDLENQIFQAYEGAISSPTEDYEGFYREPPGLSNIEDSAHMILYSVESFIMILKEDL